MAVVEEALKTRLEGHAGLAALVGTRIYPVRRPQNATLPAVTYQKVGGLSEQTHGGASGLAASRFQFDVWAATYSSASAVAEQIRVALIGFRGTVDGVEIGGVLHRGDRDLPDPLTGMFHRSIDFAIWHSEAVPA